jgi:hypothetical protein
MGQSMNATTKNTLSVVFPAPGENGLTPTAGTKVIDAQGNELSNIQEITLVAKPGEPWRAEFKTLGSLVGAVTVDAPAIPQIGEYWEGQGGYYGGIVRDGEHAWHLILAREAAKELEWGNYSVEVKNCDSRADGLANTQALLLNKTAHPAA